MIFQMFSVNIFCSNF